MPVPKPPGGPRVLTRVGLRFAPPLLLLALFSHATATMRVHLGLDKMASAAATIAEGRVEAVRGFWQRAPIVTDVTPPRSGRRSRLRRARAGGSCSGGPPST